MKYQCAYCKKLFYSESELLYHFGNCSYNPKNKTCCTCRDRDVCKSAFSFGCDRWHNDKFYFTVGQ